MTVEGENWLRSACCLFVEHTLRPLVLCGSRNIRVIKSLLFLVKCTFSGISRCPVSVGNR